MRRGEDVRATMRAQKHSRAWLQEREASFPQGERILLLQHVELSTKILAIPFQVWFFQLKLLRSDR
jgi:hypothetical protein